MAKEPFTILYLKPPNSKEKEETHLIHGRGDVSIRVITVPRNQMSSVSVRAMSDRLRVDAITVDSSVPTGLAAYNLPSTLRVPPDIRKLKRDFNVPVLEVEEGSDKLYRGRLGKGLRKIFGKKVGVKSDVAGDKPISLLVGVAFEATSKAGVDPEYAKRFGLLVNTLTLDVLKRSSKNIPGELYTGLQKSYESKLSWEKESPTSGGDLAENFNTKLNFSTDKAR